MGDHLPLHARPGFEEVRRSPLQKSLDELRRKHGLVGVVLIDFTSERVGVCSAAATAELAHHMAVLGDRLLLAIDDGQFDPDDTAGRA